MILLLSRMRRNVYNAGKMYALQRHAALFTRERLLQGANILPYKQTATCL